MELRISSLEYQDVYTLMNLAQIPFWTDGVLILDKEIMRIEKVDRGLVEHLDLCDPRAASTRFLSKFYLGGRSHVFREKECGWMGCISIWKDWSEGFKDSVLDGLKGARDVNQSLRFGMISLMKS